MSSRALKCCAIFNRMFEKVGGRSNRLSCVLSALNQSCYFVCFFALFVNCFVHNVDATVSYDAKELLDIKTGITHLKLDKELFFNE